MAPKPKNLVRTLTRRGPHRVLRGDLAFAGMPGVVCTPAAGLSLPAVVFGHDWLRRPQHYLETLAHLASWGIVAAAPATQAGAVPSARDFAADLVATLEICTDVRLGREGAISVHPDRLALAGHGFGAGAAVLAAASRERDDSPVAALAGLFTAATVPPAEATAPHVSAPALFLASPGTATLAASHTVSLAQAWGGQARTRVLPAASDSGLAEGRRWAGFFGLDGSDRKTQASVRALLTGYLLHQLTGDKDYAVFADAETELAGSMPISQDALSEPLAQESKGLARTLLSLR